MTQSSQPSLIETMRVQADGLIPLLPNHLRRLKQSAQALGYVYPGNEAVVAAITAGLNQVCSKASKHVVATLAVKRVRLLLSPGGQLSVESAPLPDLPDVSFIALTSLRLESNEPLLQHKTTYRPWYEATAKWLTQHTDFFDLIFLNEKNELCEGSRSNIYVFKNGEWLTPPLSSGLLGGVLRHHLLVTGQVKQAILMPADLNLSHAGNNPIRLSNALRGWFDVALVDLK